MIGPRNGIIISGYLPDPEIVYIPGVSAGGAIGPNLYTLMMMMIMYVTWWLCVVCKSIRIPYPLQPAIIYLVVYTVVSDEYILH